MSAVGYARAAYDYASDYAEDVTLKAGDVVQVLQQVDDSWLKGKNRNKVGYFPVTYIEPLQLPPVDQGQKLFLSTRAFCGEVQGDLCFEVGKFFILDGVPGFDSVFHLTEIHLIYVSLCDVQKFAVK
jgi:SH3 domain